MGVELISPKKKKSPKVFRRFGMKNGHKVALRVVTPSKEAINALGIRTFRTIISPIAVNRPSVERHFGPEKAALIRKLARMPQLLRLDYLKKNAPFDFVKDKEKRGYRQYSITCARCGDEVGTVWATDGTLHDWVDLHYICKHDENTWYGALSIDISKIDEQIGIECACGEDTCDYRSKKAMPPVLRDLAASYSMKHREFASPSSAFVALPI